MILKDNDKSYLSSFFFIEIDLNVNGTRLRESRSDFRCLPDPRIPYYCHIVCVPIRRIQEICRNLTGQWSEAGGSGAGQFYRLSGKTPSGHREYFA
jgi:hypothetical protein